MSRLQVYRPTAGNFCRYMGAARLHGSGRFSNCMYACMYTSLRAAAQAITHISKSFILLIFFYRTVLNHIVFSACLYLTGYIFFAFAPDLFRYTFGPIESETFCWLQLFVKNILFYAGMLCLDIHSIFKVICRIQFWSIMVRWARRG
jgi:hypothetical protein